MTRTTGILALAALASGCAASGETGLIVASGHVEATEVRLAAKVPGRLAAFPVREGERVEAGREVARVDTTDLELALAAARAEEAQAAAELALRTAGSRREDVAEAEAQAARAEAELSGAGLDLRRAEELEAGGAGTASATDAARTRRDMARSALAAADQRLRRLRAGSRVEEIESARARVEAAAARMAQLAQQVKDAAIVAPVAGIVTERLAEPGEVLAAGAAVALLVELDRPWLTVFVDEPDLGRIRLGQEVEVEAGSGDTRQGRIEFISPQAEFTPKNVQTREERAALVFRVKVALPNADGLFKPGMPAEARIRRAEG